MDEGAKKSAETVDSICTNSLENNNFFNKRLQKILGKSETAFLKQLIYWSNCPKSKNYGTERDGRIWIYNTLDEWTQQIGFSKSTIRRAIKYLKSQGLIDSAYLSKNKRDRTLFYSVNYVALDMLNRQNEHMVGVMYIRNNKQVINNKSINQKKKISKKEKVMVSASTSEVLTSSEPEVSDNKSQSKNEKLKPTIVQDMMKIWNDTLGRTDRLGKKTAEHLVAAFKTKFDNSLEKFKEYLSRIKGSVYLMSERFILRLIWIIKFQVIDDILRGAYGCVKEIINMAKQTTELTDEEKVKRKQIAIEHVTTLQKEGVEDDFCINLRKQILKKFGANKYFQWMTKVKIKHLGKNSIEIIEGPGFYKDYATKEIFSQFKDLHVIRS